MQINYIVHMSSPSRVGCRVWDLSGGNVPPLQTSPSPNLPDHPPTMSRLGRSVVARPLNIEEGKGEEALWSLEVVEGGGREGKKRRPWKGRGVVAIVMEEV